MWMPDTKTMQKVSQRSIGRLVFHRQSIDHRLGYFRTLSHKAHASACCLTPASHIHLFIQCLIKFLCYRF